MACQACGSEEKGAFFEAPAVPVACNVLCRTREEALATPRGTMRLTLCRGCGLVANEAFDEGLLRYGGTYENALHFSAEFRRYAEGLARGLVERHDLRGKRVVELGCGDGSFLSLLCRLGGCEGIGYDPAHEPARSAIEPGVNVRVERTLYGPGTAPPRADLVICRHTLEHIAQPLEFLRSVRRAIGDSGAAVFFEVPDFTYTLEHDGIWDILYEHCLYFTAAPLRSLLHRAGFGGSTCETVYGGQFLTIEAAPGDDGTDGATDAVAELAALTGRFGRGYDEKVAHWGRVLGGLRESGRSAALWGAGTKGVMFLNTVGESAGAAVSCVVDLNPRKHGCFIAGAGQRIVAPEELRAAAPGVVVVMNPVYRREIGEQLSALGVQAEVMVA